MRILYLINYAGKAGTEKYVRNLIDAFDNGAIAGERVDCFFAYNIDGPLAEQLRGFGIPCFHLKMRSPYDLSAAKKLAGICRDNCIDVIHAQYPRENYIAILSKLWYRTPRVIFTYHLVEPVPALWRITNRIMTRFNHRIITLCRRGREVLEAGGYPPQRIVIIPNGVGEPDSVPEETKKSVRASLGIPEKCIVFTIMSRYSPEKGLDTLADAALCLRDRTDEDFRVLILGDGDGYDDFARKLRGYELGDVVLQLGYREDTAELLAASDVYLNTSDYEAVSFAVLEAMSHGLPLILTDVGGNPDLAAGGIVCGDLVPPRDPLALSEAMLSMLRDADKRTVYGEAAAEKVRTEFEIGALLDSTIRQYL